MDIGKTVIQAIRIVGGGFCIEAPRLRTVEAPAGTSLQIVGVVDPMAVIAVGA